MTLTTHMKVKVIGEVPLALSIPKLNYQNLLFKLSYPITFLAITQQLVKYNRNDYLIDQKVPPLARQK